MEFDLHDILQGDDPTVRATVDASDKTAAKRQVDYYASLIDAEKNADPLKAQKLALAQQRLSAVQAERAAFNVANPDYLADQAAKTGGKSSMPSKKTLMIGAGVLAAAGASFYAWRKWKRR